MASESNPTSGDAAEDGAEDTAPPGGGGRRGWLEAARRLGEKVAIAGAAAAAASVVIPSYCVASTLGLALAIPFAAYLAVAAATEKVMTTLLPPPTPPPPPPSPPFTDLEEELDRPTTKQKGGEQQSTDLFFEALSAATEDALAKAEDDVREEDQDLGSPEAAVAAETAPPPFEVERKDVIREEIGALRRIIGYGEAAKASAAEELRALYIFTGVEPPPSLKEPCNAMEIKDKLRFLKLLVGVH